MHTITHQAWLSAVLLGLIPSIAQADPIPDIIEAGRAFTENAPVIVEPNPAPDLESFLLNLPTNSSLALVEQIEGSGNRVELHQQDGDNNIGAVFQGYGDNNQAQITQTGASNFVVLSQTGNNNQVTALEQLGNDNTVRLTQQGDSNLAQVNQFNEQNLLDLRQSDGFNNAQVSQFGGTVLDITQTNPDGSAAAINALSVSAIVEPGFVSNFGPINLNGPGQTALSLCTGSAGFCTPP